MNDGWFSGLLVDAENLLTYDLSCLMNGLMNGLMAGLVVYNH